MATFSNIPELGVAEILSGAMGGLVGSLGGKAMDTVSALKDRLMQLCEEASNGDTSVLSEIDSLNATLDAIEVTIDSLDAVLATIETTAAILEIPLTILDIALKIAKLIPMPVPPPIPVLIALLSELVAQIKQIVSAMKAVAKALRQFLDMIRKLLKRLRAMIEALKASVALMLIGGNEALQDKGVVNRDGTNILSDVGTAIGTDGGLVSVGGAEITQSVGNSGDWISTIYMKSDTRPETPTSRDFQPEGWTLIEPVIEGISNSNLNTASIAVSGVYADYSDYIEGVDTGSFSTESSDAEGSRWWSSKATVSGETGKVNGKWSRPEVYKGDGGNGDDISNLLGGSDGKDGSVSDTGVESLVGSTGTGQSGEQGSGTSEEQSGIESGSGSSSDTGSESQTGSGLDSIMGLIGLGTEEETESSKVETEKSIIARSSANGLRAEDTISTKDFLEGQYGIKSGGAVLLIDSADDAYDFLVDLVEIINAAGISLENQDKFRKIFGEQKLDKAKHYYTTPNGDILELEVVVDPKSPSIAPLYYVTATDIKSGGIVYTGTKTFATDEEVLIGEATVRLDSIFL